MSASISERFTRLGTATLGESGAQILAPGLVPLWPGARIAGRALPVHCAAGDNLAVHAAVAQAEAGEVLVVVSDGDAVRGYWGEVLTVGAMARGIAGLVIDGGVRDASEIAARSFPIFAPLSGLPGASKSGPGSVGAPIMIRGVDVRAGDWIVADRDGVVVVRADSVDAVIAAGSARADREVEMFRALESGSTTVDLLDLDLRSISSVRER
jgi:4-hydroxy-4-methyl-2-oxoglutarate aldolase